jgi:hypothetical protein
MPIDPNIALQVKPLQLNDPLAQYAQVSQIQSAQQANQLNNLKMQEYQRGLQEENQLRQLIKSGIDLSSPEAVNQMYAISPTKGLEFQKQQAGLRKTSSETSKLENELVDQKLKQSRQFLDTIDPADPTAPAKYIAWHEANHADPILGKVLTARGITAERSRATIDAAIAKGPEAFANLLNQSKLGTEKFIELNKPQNISVNRGGRTDIISTPGLGGAPTTIGNFPDVPLPPDVFAQKFKTAQAGATRVNVPVSVTTEKTYGSKFAGNMADTDINKMTAAEQAPALAASANRIIDIVNKGNVFTGPAADVKLNIARALNIAGADTNEQIANTEALIAATGTSTLAAIKNAGLGTGQGFTDKDLKFLQGVAGGTVQLTAKTLTDLAELQHRAAVRSAEAWNTRVKQIPKSALEGTGVPTEPTSVPPLSKRAGPATGSVDTNNKYLR